MVSKSCDILDPFNGRWSFLSLFLFHRCLTVLQKVTEIYRFVDLVFPLVWSHTLFSLLVTVSLPMILYFATLRHLTWAEQEKIQEIQDVLTSSFSMWCTRWIRKRNSGTNPVSECESHMTHVTEWPWKDRTLVSWVPAAVCKGVFLGSV